MTASTRPVFRDLDRKEIDLVLKRNDIGRIAFSHAGRVEIVPIHYVYDEDWIYGRTSADSAVGTRGENWWPVAFQVDETAGLFDWRSVVVHGGLYTVSPEGGPPWAREAWERGVELLRTLVPAAFLPDDPVPSRNIIFRIAVQEVTGKEASTS